MNRMERFTAEQPIAFGFVITFVFFVMLIISTLLGNLWSGDEIYGQPGSILGRVISITILLVMLFQLGWLNLAGFTFLGGWRTWLITLLPLAYSIVASTYALADSFSFNISDLSLTSQVTIFILIAAFMEEVVFRGLILHCLVRVWGNTNRGLIKIVLVSSLFFCSIHLLDFLGGRPSLNVLLQSLQASFLGIFLAALVLRSRSIYPATFFHAILNLAGYLAFGSKGIEPAPSTWLLLSLVMLPLAVLGIYQLRGWPDGPSVPSTAEQTRLR